MPCPRIVMEIIWPIESKCNRHGSNSHSGSGSAAERGGGGKKCTAQFYKVFSTINQKKHKSHWNGHLNGPREFFLLKIVLQHFVNLPTHVSLGIESMSTITLLQ